MRQEKGVGEEGAGKGVRQRGKTGGGRRREEMPRSELSVRVTVVSAARRALIGLHKDALHGLPQAVLAGARHGMNFSLTVDRPPILLPCYRQQRVSGLVTEADSLLALPYRPPTLNCPLVQVIPFPFIAKRAHLLWTSEKVIRRKGIEERVLSFVECSQYPVIY